ncbi:hypothetical protein VNI00_009978 [Paramarasmius palmivorus]|uniref:Uncharacterized protein n=1 Tax=Paramarasmius palmivorus TaxID=297713 RepID=A0AAW0CN42_9AGAR
MLAEGQDHYVTIDCVKVALWLFPSLSGHPPARRTLAFVELHDFRIQVHSSQRTPRWVEKLRRNLLYTVLNEEIRLLENADLKLEMHTAKSRNFKLDDDSDEDGEVPRSNGHAYGTEPSTGGDAECNDEAKVTFFADNWHTYNHINSRLYEFGRIDAQLRRSWTREEGTFVLVAQECRWNRILSEEELAEQRSSVESPSLLHRLASSLHLSSCHHLLRAMASTARYLYTSPMSLVDLYAPRVDVTFDHFRIHDAELYQHGSLFLKRYMDERQLWSADIWRDVLLSGVASIIGL